MERIERAVEYLGTLVEETHALAEESNKLADEVRQDRAERRRSRRLAVVVTVVVFAFTAAMLAVGLMNRVLLTRQADLNEKIQDCTNIGGVCYQEDQARDRAVIEQIGRANARANVQIVACARDHPQSDRAFRMCVERFVRGAYPELGAASPKVEGGNP